MSGVVKKIGKGIKKVGKFVKKHWKPIVIGAATLFTGGLATIGFSGLSSAIAANGFWGGLGSTMWAGATSIAGTFGIGSGAAGAAAQAAGMQGATLLTGAGAQAIGLASPGLMGPPTAAQAAASNVGTYAGPGSSFMGGGGSVFGGGANATQQVTQGLMQSGQNQLTQQQIAQAVNQGRGGLMGDVVRAALPSVVQGIGGYFQGRAAEEASRPLGFWGVDPESNENRFDPGLADMTAPAERPDGYQAPNRPLRPGEDPRQPQQAYIPPWMRYMQQAPSVHYPIWQGNSYG